MSPQASWPFGLVFLTPSHPSHFANYAAAVIIDSSNSGVVQTLSAASQRVRFVPARVQTNALNGGELNFNVSSQDAKV